MALTIKAIPTLCGDTAKKFELTASRTEANPGKKDYRHQAKVVKNYLRKINL